MRRPPKRSKSTKSAAALTFAATLILAATAAAPSVLGAIPQAVSVSPASGNGLGPQLFSYTFSDADGATNIRQAQVIIANANGSGDRCFIYVWASYPTPHVYLSSNNAYQPNTNGPIGSSTPLTSNACAIQLSASSASFSGNTFTLNLMITFQAAYAGNYTHWLWVDDWQGNTPTPSWDDFGAWTIPNGGGGGGGGPEPQLISLTPASGNTYGPQNFAFVFTDPQGANNVQQIQMMLGGPAAGCYAYIWVDSAWLYLADNSGGAWAGSGALGSASSPLSNSQCRINLVNSSQVKQGNNVTVTLNVEFFAAFGSATARTWQWFADDKNGNGLGWKPSSSTWTVPTGGGGSNSPPEPVPTTISAAGNRIGLTLAYTDVNGATDITVASARINVSASDAGGCVFKYERTSSGSMLKLLNDSGNPGPQTAFATGNVVENTQCAVTAQATQIAGANLQYTVNVQAKQGFDGEKSIWLAASDAAGAASVWRPSGTWAAQGGSSFAASDPGIYNDNLTRAVQLIRPGYSNLDYRTLTSCRYYDSQTNQLANNVTVIYDSATVATINLRITANYIAAPKLTYKFHCWGFTGSAANPVRNDAWQEGLTPLYDVTPTIISSSPSPVELDTNSERVFQVDGYGFGRATPVVEISPANGGLSVVRVDFLSLPDGRPTPHARFSLTLRGGANPGSYTIRLVSVGSGISNQFQAGPASQAISATYPVVVKAPQFRISLRGQPVTEGQTLWIDSADPTMPFRASLTSLNATGNFRFKATSRHKDTGDLGPEFVQEEERSGSCPMGCGLGAGV